MTDRVEKETQFCVQIACGNDVNQNDHRGLWYKSLHGISDHNPLIAEFKIYE